MRLKNKRPMNGLEKTIGYEFKNKRLLVRAMTHSSYANEVKSCGGNNERLEFLGDSVLSVVVSDYLFRSYDHLPEGELTRLRAFLVCEDSLWKFAQEIVLGEYLMLGKGEELSGGRQRKSILADAFEALLAAVYLDGGMNPVRAFILPIVENSLCRQQTYRDYKTALQEVTQQNPEETVEYVVTEQTGPDHDKTFVVEVHLNSNVIGRGVGHSKKQAEQQAAKEALELMGL